MRRILLSGLLLALVPVLVLLARNDRSEASSTSAVRAPSLQAGAAEHRSRLSELHARWLAAHPVHVPLVFDWPAAGSITGGYGNDDGRRHPGIDIGILRSLRVRAAAPGRVLSAGYAPGYEGYGKLVVVRSGKYKVLYAHLSRVAVHPGELVRRDERLGTAGCTGWCTGTHLHFELRRGDRTVNPLRVLASAR